MRWFFTQEKIIVYFYTLLVISFVVLTDYYLFSILRNYYETPLIIIMMSIVCGSGALLSLNSIIVTFKVIHKNAYEGIFMHKRFTSIFVLMLGGTLITIPGIITSFIGIILYIKPIRMFISGLLYKQFTLKITQLFSYFLADSIHLLDHKHKK